ncbi:tRNA pseudouridine(38-40) synthase TruA [Mobilitalea sibirica]|uniref:tRNA pseudouridine synthase A n=1 Tax=Mobilitalea sibirica TaxID=1462919 RepID=A0A8J7H2M7_9FIRM|nr:tRNA pseudouridine(38-40) synthase TruA [Mobilitalea sibirica]MBH1940815.1 tRNA pseudouridine(38-40) synthase TruA [Mobilitalea sibirica]
MYNYKLLIQYDGGRYKGWQRLGNGENTIQGKIEYVLSELIGEPTEIIGCSRTDAGVHALTQVANFKTSKEFSGNDIMKYLNHYLPQDISVIEVATVSEDFHARYHAKEKTYLYRIWNREYTNPFMRKYSMHIEDKLDITLMEEAASYFIGAHDFTAYTNAKTKKKSMVREIYSIKIHEEEGFINIRIRGNAFLYNMVRRMVGTLIEVGLGKCEPNEIPKIIEAKQRNQTGDMAQACGLYLENIQY